MPFCPLRYDWNEKVEDKGRLYNHEAFYTAADYLNWARTHPQTARDRE